MASAMTLDAMRYTLLLHWNELERAWIAQLAELPDARAGGPTIPEALRELELVAQAWLEIAKENGQIAPQRLHLAQAIDALSHTHAHAGD